MRKERSAVNAYQRDILRNIRAGRKRFLAISVITALGVMMFSGLQAACEDSRRSADVFYDAQNLHDLSIVSTLGLTQEDVDCLLEMDGVRQAEGTYSEDVTIESAEGAQYSVELQVLSVQGIDVPYLVEGALPSAVNETAVTEYFLSETGLSLGDTFSIAAGDAEMSETAETDTDGSGGTTAEEDIGEDGDVELDFELNEEEESSVVQMEYTITGIVIDVTDVDNPLSTSSFRTVGTAAVRFYVLPDAVDNELYTSVLLTLEGASELWCYSDEYEILVDHVRDAIEEEIKADREAARTASVAADAQQELDDARTEAEEALAEAEQELLDGEETLRTELAEAEQELLDGEQEIASGWEELTDAQQELTEGRTQLQEAQEELDAQEASALQQIADARVQLAEGRVQLQEQIEAYQEQEAQLNAELETLQDAETAEQQAAEVEARLYVVQQTISALQTQLAQLESRTTSALQQILGGSFDLSEQLAQTREDLNEQIAAYQAQEEELTASLEVLQAAAQEAAQKAEVEAQLLVVQQTIAALEEQLTQLDSQEALLDEQEAEALQQIADGRAQIDESLQELEDAQTQLEDAEQELLDGEQELSEGWTEYYEGKEEGEQELAEGWDTYHDSRSEVEGQLADAQAKIDDMDTAAWYVQDRYSLSGYSNIASDAESIESIAEVFPAVFLAVAVLISLTTVSRMVDEDRSLFGTYKSLGFTDREIRSKYLAYSALACAAGSAAGTLLAFVGLPMFVFLIFSVMYILPGYYLWILPGRAILGILLFFIGILAATWQACWRQLQQTPATLMRPKSPREGQRVLLERITPLWNHLSFLNKVTARNIFRYKGRMFMTVFGVGGCMALLLFGFAIRDSVTDLLPRQYDETIYYDILAAATAEDNDLLLSYAEEDGEVEEYLSIEVSSVSLWVSGGDSVVDELTVQLIVVPDDADLSSYVNLEDAESEEPLTLEEGDVIVTRNAGDVLGFGAGDSVTVQLLDLQEARLTVTAITANYMSNYIYMTRSTYESYYDDYAANGLLIHLSDSCEDPIAYAQELEKREGVVSCVSADELREDFSGAFLLINMVVYILIVMSAALAFTVLFTLSTTNTSEREREIATIKVLGFYDNEVHAYINKETLLLTGIGILAGIPLGYAFAQTLTSILRIPSLYLAVSLHTVSYLYSAGLTVIFAVLVTFLSNRTLDQVDPATALKSVE